MIQKISQEVPLTPQQQIMSSSAGPLFVSMFTTPLDVVKIRLQTQKRLCSKKRFLFSDGLMRQIYSGPYGGQAYPAMRRIHDGKWFNRPKYFSGTADAFLKISRTEGVSSLWSGLSPSLVLSVSTTVIYFATYEKLKVCIDSRRKALDTQNSVLANETFNWVSLFAGGMARLTAVTLVSPLELARTKMQSQKIPWSEVHKCIIESARVEGVRGLWKGYTATLLRDVPFSSLYWPLYEKSKVIMNLYTGKRDSNLVNFCSGAVAGSVACTATLPFDVIKSIRQIEIGQQRKSGRSRGNIAVATELIGEHGVRGLFAGLIPRLLKVAPSCAIIISSYEFCKGFFRRRNQNCHKADFSHRKISH